MDLALPEGRHTHYLTYNNGCEIPRAWVFVDVAGNRIRHPDYPAEECDVFRLAVAYYCELREGEDVRWRQITCASPDDFWTWLHPLERNRRSLWFCAYNVGAAFALLRGFANIVELGQEPEAGQYSLLPKIKDNTTAKKAKDKADHLPTGFLCDAESTTIFNLYGPKCCTHVVDARNYGGSSIEDMAASVDVEIPKMPRRAAGQPQWEEYLGRRVQTIKRYITEMAMWWYANNLGQWRPSIGGLAMAAYRHRFMRAQPLIHDCAPMVSLERKCLVGGVFQAHFVGHVTGFMDPHRPVKKKRSKCQQRTRTGPVHVYDFNSLYPAMMREHIMPRELDWFDPTADTDKYLQWSKSHCCAADVTLCSHAETYPYHENGVRYWAQGEFRTQLCGPELHQAVKNGRIIAWHVLACYLPSRMFRDYVDFFFARRREAQAIGDKATAQFAKSILCSLAGKFGQKQFPWESVRDGPPIEPWTQAWQIDADTQELTQYRAIGNMVQRRISNTEGIQSMPIITAFICAYARVLVQQVVDAAGAANVLYVGNDSVHVLAGAERRLAPWIETYPGELGKLRWIGTFETAEYRGPHDFTLDGTVTKAGLAADAETNDGRHYEQQESESFRRIVSHQPDGTVRFRDVAIDVYRAHPKGILNKDGTVSPVQVWDGTVHFERTHPRSIPAPPAYTDTPPGQES